MLSCTDSNPAEVTACQLLQLNARGGDVPLLRLDARGDIDHESAGDALPGTTADMVPRLAESLAAAE